MVSLQSVSQQGAAQFIGESGWAESLSGILHKMFRLSLLLLQGVARVSHRAAEPSASRSFLVSFCAMLDVMFRGGLAAVGNAIAVLLENVHV